MERICSQCHAIIADATKTERCPACGGEIQERPVIAGSESSKPPEVDHRGIVLPRRHALGGIITPQ